MTLIGWAAVTCTIAGQLLLGSKKRIGWIARWCAIILCMTWGALAGEWWIVAGNSFMLGVDIRGFWLWGKGEGRKA